MIKKLIAVLRRFLFGYHTVHVTYVSAALVEAGRQCRNPYEKMVLIEQLRESERVLLLYRGLPPQGFSLLEGSSETCCGFEEDGLVVLFDRWEQRERAIFGERISVTVRVLGIHRLDKAWNAIA